MKKLLLLVIIFLISIVGYGQSIFKKGIKVGNRNTTATIDSVAADGSIIKVYTGATRVYDDQLLQLATDVGDVAPTWADTTNTHKGILSYDQGVNLLSGVVGTSGKFYYLSGRVDDTAFPTAGDSTLTHTNFVGKKLVVIREGYIKQQHIDNTVSDGYKFDNATGMITFRPVLGAKEQLEIWATNTIQWEALTGEGGGGSPSALLTNLRAYFALNEVVGTGVTSSINTWSGTTTATVNSVGKSGVAELFDGVDDVISLGTSVGDIGTSDLSYSLWINFDNLPSANKGLLGNFNGASAFWYLRTKADNGLSANFNADDDPQYVTESNGALNADTWYNIGVSLDRSGNQIMYINGVAQTDVDDISSESAIAVNNSADFNIGNIGSSTATYFSAVKIDEVAIYVGRVLSPADFVEIYNSGAGKFYPF